MNEKKWELLLQIFRGILEILIALHQFSDGDLLLEQLDDVLHLDVAVDVLVHLGDVFLLDLVVHLLDAIF